MLLNQTHLDSLSLDPIPCCLASLLRCLVLTAPVRGSTPTSAVRLSLSSRQLPSLLSSRQLPSAACLSAVQPPTALCSVASSTASLASPSHFRIRRDFMSKNPLSGSRQNRQRESSALAAYPHSAHTLFNEKDFESVGRKERKNKKRIEYIYIYIYND